MFTVSGAPERILGLDHQRRLVEALHRGVEVVLEVRVGGAQDGWAAQAAKIAVNELAGADHQFSTMLMFGGDTESSDHAADALGVIPEHEQGQLGAVGDPVDVPFVDAQGHAQVGDVGGVLGGVVGGDVDAGGGHPVPAVLDDRRVRDRGGLRREGHADGLVEEHVELGAAEERVGVVRAPLVHVDDLALGVEALLDHR